ncbi:hypothetical protein GCM10028784_22990 [Myceligenerans cantabricum]
MLRNMMVLVLAVAAGGLLSACAPSPEAGSCVAESASSFEVVDCGTARLKVLDVVDSSDASGCLAVAGVTASYSESGAGTLCVGPVDADPRTAVNVATPGDCVAGIEDEAQDVRRVGCGRPAAEAAVLKVLEDAATAGVDGCAEVPGTTSSYAWSLDPTGDSTTAGSDGRTSDLLFCLGPVGFDPKTAPELAKVGDCLQERVEDPRYAIVDCGSPRAAYQVVERSNSSALPIGTACGSGATYGIQGGSAVHGWTLCLAAP